MRHWLFAYHWRCTMNNSYEHWSGAVYPTRLWSYSLVVLPTKPMATDRELMCKAAYMDPGAIASIDCTIPKQNRTAITSHSQATRAHITVSARARPQATGDKEAGHSCIPSVEYYSLSSALSKTPHKRNMLFFYQLLSAPLLIATLLAPLALGCNIRDVRTPRSNVSQ